MKRRPLGRCRISLDGNLAYSERDGSLLCLLALAVETDRYFLARGEWASPRFLIPATCLEK